MRAGRRPVDSFPRCAVFVRRYCCGPVHTRCGCYCHHGEHYARRISSVFYLRICGSVRRNLPRRQKNAVRDADYLKLFCGRALRAVAVHAANNAWSARCWIRVSAYVECGSYFDACVLLPCFSKARALRESIICSRTRPGSTSIIRGPA